jgi:hypothetical protein
MERHAEVICRGGGDVLNVGFGMGIIDGFIQQHQVGGLALRSHGHSTLLPRFK